MPLTERERRILEEIEKNLYEEDPKFAQGGGPSKSTDARNAKLGIGLFFLGFVALLFFFFSELILIGVAAFGAMVGGIVLFAGSFRGLTSRQGQDAGTTKDRMSRAFADWEERVRKRYKRP